MAGFSKKNESQLCPIAENVAYVHEFDMIESAG
jgi:hypothetical protein